MQNDDITVVPQDETTEGQPPVSEETPGEGEGDTPQGTPPAPKADDVVKLSPAEFRHYKKWKDSQAQPAAVPPQPASAQPNVEETVLLANGMSEDLMKELKAVAQARGISSLIKAQNDPIFVAVKEKFEKDQRQKEASLPASRGSGSIKPKKSIDTPGLSREEHMAMAKQLS